MAGDDLSQAEVESLLGAMEANVQTAREQTPGAAQPTASMLAASRSRDKIIPYDFKRPERVGKEQMRALQSLHEGFGRNFGAALSALLRTIVEVKLTSVDQLTYSEFVFSLENPSYFNVLKAEPLEGNLILDINPSILFPVIDRLLGGGKESGPTARRPLTEIELRLVSRLTNLFLIELHNAWENVVELELDVERVESNPQLVQIVPPNEVVVLISFELTIGDIRGMMHLCIPFNAIERIGNQLTSNTWVSYGKSGASEQSQQRIGRQLSRSMVEIAVQLANARITTADLLRLRVGDIIATDQDAGHPLTVHVENVPKFHARAGAIKGHKAFQVESVVPVYVEAEEVEAPAAG